VTRVDLLSTLSFSLDRQVEQTPHTGWQKTKPESLKRLISKITLDVWKTDQKMTEKLLGAEKAQNEMNTINLRYE